MKKAATSKDSKVRSNYYGQVNFNELFIQEEKLKRELWETMIATFMNNIQIQIDRVHIRYEDSISVPGTGSKIIKIIL